MFFCINQLMASSSQMGSCRMGLSLCIIALIPCCLATWAADSKFQARSVFWGFSPTGLLSLALSCYLVFLMQTFNLRRCSSSRPSIAASSTSLVMSKLLLFSHSLASFKISLSGSFPYSINFSFKRCSLLQSAQVFFLATGTFYSSALEGWLSLSKLSTLSISAIFIIIKPRLRREDIV